MISCGHCLLAAHFCGFPTLQVSPGPHGDVKRRGSSADIGHYVANVDE